MATSTYEAQAIHREMMAKIAQRVVATLPVRTDSFDSDGNPVTTLSADATPAFGEKVVVIRTKPMDWTYAKNSLGQDPFFYGPHVIQMCTEKNYEGATDSVLDILAPAEIQPILFETARTGCMLQWFRTANGTVPSTAAMISTNLADDTKPSPYGMVSSQ